MTRDSDSDSDYRGRLRAGPGGGGPDWPGSPGRRRAAAAAPRRLVTQGLGSRASGRLKLRLKFCNFNLWAQRQPE